MVSIKKQDIVGEPAFLPVFSKGIHGGFIKKEDLPHDELEYCNKVSWVKKRVQFFCSYCQMNHVVEPDDVICPARQVSVQNPELAEGFQITPEAKFPEPEGSEYKVEVAENRKQIDPEKISTKTIYFVPQSDGIDLYTPTGKIAVAPLDRLPEAFTKQDYEDLIFEIRDLVKDTIKWSKLDSDGDDFQELTYRLLRLEDQFDNVSPGGTGQDQGKDGFCDQQIGRRKVRTMVQVKFNNEGSGLNKSDITSMIMDAESHDCKGLLVTTIKTTGDLETKLNNPNFGSRMQYLDVWEEIKMKAKISKYPSLVQDYFLN